MEQIITCLEYEGQKKVKVYINDSYAFLLYYNDIKKYGLKERMVIEEQLYDQIMEETIIRRAKQKAMAILKRMDRTEQELRIKLIQTGYPELAVQKAIEYVKAYHYIDDIRYVENYIRYKQGNKSMRMIQAELVKKGIERENIQLVLENVTISDDEALKKAIRKKVKNWEEMTFQERSRVFSYLYGKGFKQEDIRKYLEF